MGSQVRPGGNSGAEHGQRTNKREPPRLITRAGVARRRLGLGRASTQVWIGCGGARRCPCRTRHLRPPPVGAQAPAVHVSPMCGSRQPYRPSRRRHQGRGSAGRAWVSRRRRRGLNCRRTRTRCHSGRARRRSFAVFRFVRMVFVHAAEDTPASCLAGSSLPRQLIQSARGSP